MHEKKIIFLRFLEKKAFPREKHLYNIVRVLCVMWSSESLGFEGLRKSGNLFFFLIFTILHFSIKFFNSSVFCGFYIRRLSRKKAIALRGTDMALKWGHVYGA